MGTTWRSLRKIRSRPGWTDAAALAGALNVTTVLFLLFDAMGALFWSAGYCFLGYLFSDRLNVVAAMVARTSKILAIVLACVLCYLLLRAWELLRTIRQLRLRTISPTLLHEEAAGR